jgi:hypothetical protein
MEVTLSAAFLLAAGTAAVSVGLTIGRFTGKLDAFDARLRAMEESDSPNREEFNRHEAGLHSNNRHLAEAKGDIRVLMDRDMRPERKP